MDHFHNILGIIPKKAGAMSQQDVWFYWVKKEPCFFFSFTVSDIGWLEYYSVWQRSKWQKKKRTHLYYHSAFHNAPIDLLFSF